MKTLTDRIKNTVFELKTKFGAFALKADFASEAISFDDLNFLKELSGDNKTEFFVKIGGCEAYNDIFMAKEAGVSGITAPMIETAYSLEKYINTLLKHYTREELLKLKIGITIETATAFRNIDEILTGPGSEYVSSVVLGRDDMTESIKLSRSEINSNIMLRSSKALASKIRFHAKKFVLGGEIRPCAVSFLREALPDEYETRKIVFNAKEGLSMCTTEGIIKALEFEILWLEFQSERKGYTFKGLRERINKLKEYTGECFSDPLFAGNY